ncbi:hypothetical protein MicloDRAFT_00006640 [Microvirga lotononidis]|uniref:Uncharacterized protein n=1 Tax=Microvirga lotononidis TaxID=864069 RepID=I4Z3G9_9HYPH|nr:hypothetical protein MicloDRAFT_00006640 [Microvirga lotononidis]
MIPKNGDIGLQMRASVRELTGLSPSATDPMDMDSTIGLATENALAPDEDMAGGLPLQQNLASAEMSVQAFGEQGHVWPPAAPLEAVAGPGGSARGLPAADCGASDNPEDKQDSSILDHVLDQGEPPAWLQDHLGLLDQAEPPAWLQDQRQLFPLFPRNEAVAGPSGSARGLPAGYQPLSGAAGRATGGPARAYGGRSGAWQTQEAGQRA